LSNHVLPDFLDRESGQRKSEFEGKLTSQGLNLNDEGRKAGFTPAPRLRLKARQSSKGEPFAPFADNLTRRIQSGSDDIIGQAFVCEEDNFGSNHVAVR
jgi:hypothetical protein